MPSLFSTQLELYVLVICVRFLLMLKLVFHVQLVGVRSSCSSGKGRSHQGPIKITYGFCLVKGKANHPMEDYHVAKFLQIKDQEVGLFAIYDGHLGDSVPAYLQKHLFSNILKEVGY